MIFNIIFFLLFFVSIFSYAVIPCKVLFEQPGKDTELVNYIDRIKTSKVPVNIQIQNLFGIWEHQFNTFETMFRWAGMDRKRSEIAEEKPLKILDIGCGDAMYWPPLISAATGQVFGVVDPKRVNVRGIELNPHLSENDLKRLASMGKDDAKYALSEHNKVIERFLSFLDIFYFLYGIPNEVKKILNLWTDGGKEKSYLAFLERDYGKEPIFRDLPVELILSDARNDNLFRLSNPDVFLLRHPIIGSSYELVYRNNLESILTNIARAMEKSTKPNPLLFIVLMFSKDKEILDSIITENPALSRVFKIIHEGRNPNSFKFDTSGSHLSESIVKVFRGNDSLENFSTSTEVNLDPYLYVIGREPMKKKKKKTKKQKKKK